MRFFVFNCVMVALCCVATAASAGGWGFASSPMVEPAVTEPATVILVRHAERPEVAGDPPLNEKGQQRAALLAKALGDARVDTILVSDVQRTQQTARPLSDLQGVPTTKAAFTERSTAKEVSTAIRAQAKPGRVVLVVAHSNQIAGVLKELGGWEVPELKGDQYDFMFVATIREGGKSSLIRAGYPPSAN